MKQRTVFAFVGLVAAAALVGEAGALNTESGEIVKATWAAPIVKSPVVEQATMSVDSTDEAEAPTLLGAVADVYAFFY